jgi:hypothetical protein
MLKQVVYIEPLGPERLRIILSQTMGSDPPRESQNSQQRYEIYLYSRAVLESQYYLI